MDTDKILIDRLEAKGTQLKQKIEQLNADFDAIVKTVEILLSGKRQVEEAHGFEDATMLIVKANPSKRWKTFEIRDQMEKMRDDGRLKSKAKYLTNPLYRAISALIQEQRLVQIGAGRDRRIRLRHSLTPLK